MAGRPASRNRHGRPRDPMPGWLPPGSCALGTVPRRGVIASRASIRRPPPWTLRRFAPPISIRPQQAATDRTPKAGSAGIDHSKQWSGCDAGLPGESLQTTCHGADPQPGKVRSAPFHLCNAPPHPGQACRNTIAPGTPPRRAGADAAFTATHRLPLVAESGPPLAQDHGPAERIGPQLHKPGPPRRPKRSHQDQGPAVGLRSISGQDTSQDDAGVAQW